MKKNQRFLCITTMVTALFLAFLMPVTGAETTKNYLPLPGTESPDGKYSLAWNDEESLSEISETDTTKNYIVDTVAKKIVRTLENSDYFTIDGIQKNHAAMLCSWSEDSNLLLYGLSSKWQTDTLDLYKIASNTVFERYELMPVIEKEVRNFLEKEKADDYKKYGESIVVVYSDAAISKAGILNLTASIEVPKQEEFYATLKISAQTDLSNKLSVKLLSVVIKEEP
ncbi:MAG: hypothetical protein KKB51_03565 [Candidatus Riflebacteria bacterium]|nr:hypothetical protein [Candidatus Riflebacteria bacterium]